MADGPELIKAIHALHEAGIVDHREPVQLGVGCDNIAFAVTANDGRELVVRVRTSGRSRYHVARYVGQRVSEAGLPVPRVLWHDEDACLETYQPGVPLDDPASAARSRENAAKHLGTVMIRWHQLAATGFGSIGTDGVGRHPSLAAWLLDLPEPEDSDSGHVADRAQQVLKEFAAGPAPRSRLLHGDLVARHVLVGGGWVNGIVDLDSARAGDPLTEIAGWTLREDPVLTDALAATYFPDGPGPQQLTALAVYRVRIALSMRAFHCRRRDFAYARKLLACINADLEDLAADRPHLVPRHQPTPRDPLHGGTR